MDNISAFKTDRVLRIYSELVQGRVLTKRGLAQQFSVTERSIQRDLSALRCFLAEQGAGQNLVYDKATGGYYLQDTSGTDFEQQRSPGSLQNPFGKQIHAKR